MTTEQTGGGKLTQSMTYHVVGYVNRDMASAVMYGDGMTYHLGEDCAGAAPSANHFFVAGVIHFLNLL